MLTGLEMFGSFPAAVTAMRRSKINVCATVGSLSDLADTARDSPSERFETLHFDDAEALICAILSERVELPDVSILHSTLGVCQSPQLKIGAHFAAVKQAEQTLNLMSALNAMQACHPIFIATLVMPFKLLSTLRPIIAQRASDLGYSAEPMALRASNHGAFTSLRVAMLVLRRRDDGNIDMPTMREPFKSDIDIGKIFNLNDIGVPLDSSPFPVELCMYSGGKGLAAGTEATATRHRQLAAIPIHHIKCYSMQFPIPPITTRLPSIVTNASSCASLWRARKISHKEACSAYTLTDRMQEESANMTETMLAATLSTAAPLSLLEQCYGSVETCVTSY
jgi:hypothetical protein